MRAPAADFLYNGQLPASSPMPASNPPLVKWNAPGCPFTVMYAPRVLDDIRLAVVDAFFSLPRGGAEIGGILLGRQEAGRVIISDWRALECEHALGPSFTLSHADRARLAELIAAAEKGARTRPVGWYHSHTRSEIFLSEADLEIHRQFFPEPWQVALVMRPHTFNPTRAGFFFRAENGSIQAEASPGEFVLDPLPSRPLPSEEEPAVALPSAERSASAAFAGRVVDVTEVQAENAAEPEPPPAAVVEPPPPRFLNLEPARHSRRWLVVAGAVVGVAAGAGVYSTRAAWLPALLASSRPAPPVAEASLGLRMTERDGQLQIHWDPAAVRNGRGGTILIADGAQSRTVPLDAAGLQRGSLPYTRQSGTVEATLAFDQPDGRKRIESSSFTGPSPAPTAAAPPALTGAATAGDAASGAELRQQRDALAEENARLKQRVARQAARIVQLEKDLDIERRLLELRSRMQNQSTGNPK